MSPGRILAVDDVPANLGVLEAMLGTVGYTVDTAANASQAFECAQAAAPDAILLDINMPDVDGYALCERFKGDERFKDIPVLFLSALTDIGDKVRAFEVGGVDYVTKPFQMEEVLSRVAAHIGLYHLKQRTERDNAYLESVVNSRTAELQALNRHYQRFVPQAFLRALECDDILGVRLGIQREQQLTILFADIRDFTGRTERSGASAVFSLLNRYFGRIAPLVRGCNGVIDKYIGDAIMALFPGSPADAISCALQMQASVAELSDELVAAGDAPLSIGIGIHVGSAILGIVGTEQRMQATVISDAVNVAARIEALCKEFGAGIVISDDTLNRAEGQSDSASRALGVVQVKGRSEPIRVHELFDPNSGEAGARKQALTSVFEEGLELYIAGKFAESTVRFSRAVEQDPEDRVYRYYLEKAVQQIGA